MQVYVGTSGWFYDWNKARSLDWYIINSGLNAVELNASFYRFPFPNQISAWAKKTKSLSSLSQHHASLPTLRWSVKVNRLITHVHKFNINKSMPIWQRFYKLFKPLDPYIDFYLFQLHPKFVDLDLVTTFANKTKLGNRFALEIRNKELIKNIKDNTILGDIVLVSVDSPVVQNKIFKNNIIYMRMHGRKSWYEHNYTKAELRETIKKIKKSKPAKVYIFFNNDHDMLNNARLMLNLMKQ